MDGTDAAAAKTMAAPRDAFARPRRDEIKPCGRAMRKSWILERRPSMTMPRHGSDNARMDQPDWFFAMQYWTYRVGGFVLMNVLDDPAWLAMIFC